MFAWILLTACRNPCQQLCAEIRDFAANECGQSFPEDQFRACLQDQRGGQLNEGERGVCRRHGERVAEEWTCDDVADYFGGGGDEAAEDES